jgi:hypothetical protein
MMGVGSPKRTHSLCCEAELIITPAYPTRERVVRCGSCGKPNINDRVHALNKINNLWDKVTNNG